MISNVRIEIYYIESLRLVQDLIEVVNDLSNPTSKQVLKFAELIAQDIVNQLSTIFISNISSGNISFKEN